MSKLEEVNTLLLLGKISSKYRIKDVSEDDINNFYDDFLAQVDKCKAAKNKFYADNSKTFEIKAKFEKEIECFEFLRLCNTALSWEGYTIVINNLFELIYQYNSSFENPGKIKKEELAVSYSGMKVPANLVISPNNVENGNNYTIGEFYMTTIYTTVLINRSRHTGNTHVGTRLVDITVANDDEILSFVVDFMYNYHFSTRLDVMEKIK